MVVLQEEEGCDFEELTGVVAGWLKGVGRKGPFVWGACGALVVQVLPAYSDTCSVPKGVVAVAQVMKALRIAESRVQ